MITQKSYTVELPDKTMNGYLSGTLLYHNNRFFGPGMYRISTEYILNVGQKIKAPVLIEVSNEGLVVQARRPWSLLSTSERETLMRKIRRVVDSNGFAYVEGLATQNCDETECTTNVLEMSRLLGSPMPHDTNGQEVWRIAVKQENSLVPTFSQHAGEAGLHTDSQYRQNPEDAFALFTVSQATCGGGESWILHHDDIVESLRTMPDGEKHYHLLKTTPVPFAVPSIFNIEEDGDGHVEVILATIFEGNTIRYRQDTLATGIKHHPIEDESIMQALEALEKAVHDNSKTTILKAENGSCFFIDNKRTLHGRSGFSDANRLMLRCRFNFKASDAPE
jgi:alpha-ketoglutarate-dependent taurine dioxygenase